MTVEKIQSSKLFRDFLKLDFPETEKLSEDFLFTSSIPRTELIEWLLNKFEPKYPELIIGMTDTSPTEALALVLDTFGFSEYSQAVEFVEARSTPKIQYSIFCELTSAALNALPMSTSSVDSESGSTELDLVIENGCNFLDLLVDGELDSVLVSQHSVFSQDSPLMDVIKSNSSQSDDSFDSVDELIEEQGKTLQELKNQLSKLEDIKSAPSETSGQDSMKRLASVTKQLTETLKKFDTVYVNEIYPWVEAFTQNLPPRKTTTDFGPALISLDEKTSEMNELLDNYNIIKHSHAQLAEYWSKHVESNGRLLTQDLSTKRLAEMERINTILRKALERKGLSTTTI
ncbi:hypothetical protein K7432_000895 [Basidiobolus ranarum]|uniref:HAUS augmin-like complex subunit 7 n=1 Tax=Basidiobolus ranarum TaxID=34480 RepID=A0ABR2WAG6_9FUNG